MGHVELCFDCCITHYKTYVIENVYFIFLWRMLISVPGDILIAAYFQPYIGLVLRFVSMNLWKVQGVSQALLIWKTVSLCKSCWGLISVYMQGRGHLFTLWGLKTRRQCHLVCPWLGTYILDNSNFCHSAHAWERLQKSLEHRVWSYKGIFSK